MYKINNLLCGSAKSGVLRDTCPGRPTWSGIFMEIYGVGARTQARRTDGTKKLSHHGEAFALLLFDFSSFSRESRETYINLASASLSRFFLLPPQLLLSSRRSLPRVSRSVRLRRGDSCHSFLPLSFPPRRAPPPPCAPSLPSWRRARRAQRCRLTVRRAHWTTAPQAKAPVPAVPGHGMAPRR